LVQQNQLVLARTKLNAGLMDPRSTPAERAQIRAQIASINETLFFSPTVSAGDAITDTYTVASGDSLVRITRKQGLPIDWRLLQRINRLPSENALRVGQKIKIVRLPIHAVVHKNDYRMDLYAGSPPAGGSGTSDLGPDGQERDWVYIRSFRVGLGESNGTPEGTFVVRPNSKLVNPRWVNPRTGEVFEADNPANPIGERWIGLDGSDDNTRKFVGYGVHGTVDPDSIGQQRSMGCVRLASDDVAVVYELLVDRLSTVKIIK
jgi:LysM repeat protein